MKVNLLHIVFFFCLTQILNAQEDGVVAFDLPVRNSLKFNRYAINPTFSFVREQNKYISFTNKREWVQFDNAPQTYLFSYSGRFRENIGVGLGLFQQNYGVLTTFGGVANFAYNAVFDRDSNLTFGMNIGFYNSGINDGEVITNFQDPSLNNIPSNSVITVNPGINYGTTFFDFGASINNLAAYNLTTSKMIEDNPEQSVQAHVMYTGYLDARGFFDESKFSTLLMSEFKKEETVLSGIIMVTIPKGIWAQAGYNTLYGVSGGVGLNISNQISIEYNYEKAIGDLDHFGNSHEITLAYKFKNKFRYDYSGDDDEQALLISDKKRKPTIVKSTSTSNTKIDREAIALENKRKLEEKAALVAQKKADAKAKIEEKEQSVEDVKSDNERVEAEEQSKLLAEQQAIIKAEEAKSKLAEAAKLRAEAEAKQIADQKNQAKLVEEAQAKLRAEEAIKEKLLEEERVKAELELREKLLAEQQAQSEKIEEAKLNAEAEAKQIEEQENQTKLAEETQAKLRVEEATKEKLLEEEKLKAEELARTKAAAEKKVDTVELDGVLFSIARDREALAMKGLTELTENSKIEQQKLLIKLSEKIASKQKDLDDLKEENDLSEQGIYTAPKAFKSVTAENAALEVLKIEIDNIIESQNLKISELEGLYKERLKTIKNKNDSTNIFYSRKIQELKTEQLNTIQSKENLLSTLVKINVATEFERKRRIKRAAYDNQEAKYLKDRNALKQIKQTTEVNSVALTENDFDFGEEPSSNIRIVKDIQNAENGYYLVIAVHNDAEKRDDFLRKVVSNGRADIDFFYDVNTSKYYIYYKKFNDIGSAKRAIESKGNEAYNSKMSMVKIEN